MKDNTKRDALIADVFERLSKVRQGHLTGVGCVHGFDTSVCPMRGCGDDEETLITELLAALPALLSRIEELEAGLRTIAEGGVPRPVGKIWRTDGKPSKHDYCTHDVAMWGDCGNCIADFARALAPSEQIHD